MKITLATITLFLLCTIPAAATTPPPILNLPAPLFGGQTQVVPPLPPTPPLGVPSLPVTKAELDAYPFSGSVYYTTLAQLGSFGHFALPVSSNAKPQTDFEYGLTSGKTEHSSAAAQFRKELSSTNKPHLALQADAVTGTVDYTRNVTFDTDSSDQWLEPTVQAIKIGVTDYTTVVAARMTGTLSTAVSRLRYATTTDRVNFSRGEMPMPAGYAHSADPYLASNPYNAGSSPLTMWCSGILHNGVWNVPNAVVLWRSTNGGTAWTITTVALNSSDTNHFLDKPAIAVNWANNSQLLGNVYVAYTRFDRRNSQLAEVHVARVRTTMVNGVATVTVDSDIIVETGDVADPQVVASYTNGRVYVIYNNFATHRIRMATVNDVPSSTLSLYRLEDATATRPLINGYNLNGGIRANSVPIARFNGARNRIFIAWHENEPNATTTAPRADVWYTSVDLRTDPDPGIWAGERALSATANVDEFLPGMDVNSAGDTLITFYTKRYDPANNLLYNDAFSVVNTSDVTQGPYDIPGETGVVVTYDPTQEPIQPGFIGDYQDVWNWTYGTLNLFHSTWARTAQSDIELSAIR